MGEIYTCKVPGCNRDVKTAGTKVCATHLWRMKNYGEYNPVGMKIYEKHGMHKSPEYAAWEGMKDRCYNKNKSKYKNHGGRGIIMCEEWKNSFLAFYRDMGNKPEGTSLDREDNDGNYEKENCRWTDITTQNINKIPSRPNKYGYIGVSVSHSRFKAEISFDKKKWHIGTFDTSDEAAWNYDMWAAGLHGDIARQNFEYK